MRLSDNKLEFSISDVVRYFKSPYSSWATWANLVSPGHIFVENDMVQNSSLLARSEENENSAKSFLINKYSQVKTIKNPLDEIEESKTLIKEEVTGSNPVAPTRVFQKYTHKKTTQAHTKPTFC